MRRNLTPYAVALSTVALTLAACQQRQEDTPDAAAPAADVTVNPPPNVTVQPPDVNVKTPDVNIDAAPPEGKVTRETTVDVPGVGTTTTTTVEKK